MVAVVLISALIGTYRIAAHGMQTKPCPTCGRAMHVNATEAGTYLSCSKCIYSESQPATGAFSWANTLEYVVTEYLIAK